MIISLTKGYEALISDEDFEFINQWRWHFKGGYAVRTAQISRINGKKITKKIFLHREILKTPEGSFTDHINGNPLDNRRENLRVCTNLQNQANKKKFPDTTSKFKGVCWDARARKWMAYISINSKNKHLGHFNDQLDASNAYMAKATELFGEFARRT